MLTLKEKLLGVVFGVEYFKHFTFGNEVHMITNHKPLVSLTKEVPSFMQF